MSGQITVVSGYPRSGTSLMMQMLAAGGMDVLTDDTKTPDEHNPRGYFEFGPALKLGGKETSTDWVDGAVGRVVKVMAYQLRHLPETFEYRVLFMRRRIAEVLASWNKMKLTRPDVRLSEREQILAFKTEYAVYEATLERRKNFRVLFVQYNELLASPDEWIEKVAGFLGDSLDRTSLDRSAMRGAIDYALYRNRLL